ncbi:CinA family protein [Actinomycetospora termitidis]|uniref:CinA family protein n=1 Tax=Actinomycetospora termitidis TaxID=3053470 RepID=A0ABT7M8Z5_9PSEU|nr:CinA family protein [Actinomycetospora sp. Odt1-22]MDL5156257.1 CinA family protein [Actinomycetospora sp. Odt1-22]
MDEGRDRPPDEAPEDLAKEISDGADRDGRRIAVVESLTGGLVSSDLAAAPGSSEWFRGGVVAYDRTTKHGVLGVPDGPVVAEPAVRAMAESAAEMFGADVVVAVSGAGGPDPQDDQPPGTVWFAVSDHGTTDAWVKRFPGDPPDVLKATRIEALHALREHTAAAHAD